MLREVKQKYLLLKHLPFGCKRSGLNQASERRIIICKRVLGKAKNKCIRILVIKNVNASLRKMLFSKINIY